jgi:NDP-sugar pyrophosphorylase family protein
MCRRAVILAGGRGTRLKPYTVVLPKPLMPIGEYPILEVVVRQLVSYDFTHITMAVNHQADIIRAFFGDGSKWNIKIDYSLEDRPLSTMGPLRLIRDLPEDFLIMNGDVLTNMNFGDFYEYHTKNRNLFTISTYKREQVSEYGVLEIDNAGTLCGFKEKPVFPLEVSMGVYMANLKIMDIIPENTIYGFDHLMLDLIRMKKPAKVKKFDGYWLDIGRPDDYALAIDEFEKNKEIFLKES